MLSRIRNPNRFVIPALGLVVVMGFGFAGCAGKPTLLPTDAVLPIPAAMQEGASCDSLQRGRALAVTQCANCHRFYFPYEYKPSQWPALANDMGRRALLTQRQIGDLTRYMVAASRATRSESESEASEGTLPPADLDSVLRGRTATLAKCAQCHRLVQPQEYATDAWPRIVQSMAARSRLTEDEVRDITAFHVETARRGR